MSEIILSPDTLAAFATHLRSDEKSPYTIEKYVRDVRVFMTFAADRPLTKDLVLEYKAHLINIGNYGNASINSMLASINTLLNFLDCQNCKVSNIRVQRKLYCPDDRKLDHSDYKRLKAAAIRKPRLAMILETIFSTGIRISELRYFTVEALQYKEINVSCKNKTRTIIVPTELRKRLHNYIKQNNITSGVIFRTRTGQPVNRSNIWAEMKKLCEKAKVSKSKVFPHNLRKLFARLFYKKWKDIAQLADLLGHSSINTTRIYIMTTEREVRNKVEQMVISLLE